MYIQKYLKYKNKYITLKAQLKGGSLPVAPVATGSAVLPCPGVVNAQPSVIVPGKKQAGGSLPVAPIAPVVPATAALPCPGIVNAQPIVPTQKGGKLELSDTDEIKKLFGQLGGKKNKKKKNSSESDSDSSIFYSDSSSLFGSDFDEEISLNDI